MPIDLKTSFRWRHGFLHYALTTNDRKLSGIIEVDEVFTRVVSPAITGALAMQCQLYS